MVLQIFIYKITNILNNKVYIGQSVRPIEQRFKRHINDAVNNNLDTHLARAIRKYGVDKFIVKQIDSALSQEELNRKEQYWIQFYDSVHTGYNETDAIYKCGGNTYQSKTAKEMDSIKSKLRKTKISDNNPNAKGIKCLNIKTNEELFFSTINECRQYFEEKTHRFITNRVTKRTRSLYKDEWNIAYIDDEYTCKEIVNKRGTLITVTNLKTNAEKTYESIRLASRMCNIKRNKIVDRAKKEKEFILDGYKFTVLN